MGTYSLDRPLPDGLSARSALDAYLDENGFTTAEYDARTVTVTFWGFSFTLPNLASRRLASPREQHYTHTPRYALEVFSNPTIPRKIVLNGIKS